MYLFKSVHVSGKEKHQLTQDILRTLGDTINLDKEKEMLMQWVNHETDVFINFIFGEIPHMFRPGWLTRCIIKLCCASNFKHKKNRRIDNSCNEHDLPRNLHPNSPKFGNRKSNK